MESADVILIKDEDDVGGCVPVEGEFSFCPLVTKLRVKRCENSRTLNKTSVVMWSIFNFYLNFTLAFVVNMIYFLNILKPSLNMYVLFVNFQIRTAVKMKGYLNLLPQDLR